MSGLSREAKLNNASEAVIENLKGRKGFDYWWDSLEENIKDEIVESLWEVIDNHMTED